jgi:hypothetical protein
MAVEDKAKKTDDHSEKEKREKNCKKTTILAFKNVLNIAYFLRTYLVGVVLLSVSKPHHHTTTTTPPLGPITIRAVLDSLHS